MKRILLLFAVFFIAFTFSAIAQRTVTGKVTDETGESLPGANVVVDGTTTGTTTDLDGKYSLSVPEGSSLKVSFIGYVTQVIEVGSKSIVDVSLETERLEDVVITAAGIEVNRNRVASSTSKVEGGSLRKSGETGVIQSLTGKASGVSITKNSGDPGAGAYIQIRGQSTITRSVQPLVIIDGVPMSNSEVGNSTEGVTQQSRLNDLNPNDIEDVQILKGASASALWGSRAANGVIMITTKKGSKGKVKVTYNGTYSIDRISYVHDLQQKFGKGLDGKWSGAAGGRQGGSWGDKISERAGGADEVDKTNGYFEALNGTKYYPVTKKNDNKNYEKSNFDAVFRDGSYFENNISLSGGNEMATFYMSLSDMNQKGIIKNNSDYRRTTGRINTNFRFNEIVSAKANFGYSSISSNRIQQGSNLGGLYLGFLRNPADFDIRDYKGTYYNAAGIPSFNSHRSYRSQLGNRLNPIYNNPLWTVNEQTNTSDVDRFISSFQLNVSPIDWLTLTARVGADFYTDRRVTLFPKNSGNTSGNGNNSNRSIKERQLNADFIANSTFDFSDKFNANFLLGFNLNSRGYLSQTSRYQNFILDNRVLDFGNATNENTFPSIGESVIRTSAGYINANFAYDETFFLNLTSRLENSSTFGNSSAVFFYPSVELGILFSKLLNVDALSNGKLRVTYGEVGTQPAVFSDRTYYVAAGFSEGWGPAASASGYDGAFQRSAVLGNKDVKPERKKEFEVGIDLSFLKDRFNLSTTYYSNKIEGALFNVPVAASTGYSRKYDNAANMKNNGIEVDASFDIVKTKDFTFNLGANWNMNRNLVTSLSGTKSLFLAGFTGTSSRAVEGKPLGTLWGGRFDRDENGKLNLTDDGFPKVAATEGILGDPNPEWRGGLNSRISFKGLSLYVLFERKEGGDMWDGTSGALHTFGRESVTANEQTVTADQAASLKTYSGKTIDKYAGAKKNDDGTYTFRGNIKNFGGGDVALTQEWYRNLGGGFGPVGEQFVKDGTWTRLREITLSYQFPSSIVSKLKMSNLSLSATGRNLFIWTNEDFGIDPESNLTGGSNGRGLLYFNNPGTKSFLFSLTATF